MNEYQKLLSQFVSALHEGGAEVRQYSNNYLGSHLAALETSFPTVCYYLSQKTFRALAQIYGLHTVPEQWDINRYGASFADWVEQQQHGPKSEAYHWRALAVLARLEYGLICTYYPNKREGAIGFLLDGKETLLLANLRGWQEQLVSTHPYLRIPSKLSPGQGWRIALSSPFLYLKPIDSALKQPS